MDGIHFIAEGDMPLEFAAWVSQLEQRDIVVDKIVLRKVKPRVEIFAATLMGVPIYESREER